MKPLVLPQVNLNGTSRKVLVEQQSEVLRALENTITAMLAASPHGRDYQFRPAEYETAKAAWLDRIEVVTKMQKEIEVHAMAIHMGEDR